MAASARAAASGLAGPTAVLILVSTAHAITHVYAALFPLIYPIVQREWNVPYVLLGAVIGLASFLGGLLQLLFGVIGRVYPRNLVLGLGNLFWGLSTGLTGLTTSFGPFAALRFVAAAANAPQHPVGLGMISDRYPRERRGVALAVNYAGGNLGTLLVPLVAVLLIETIGWQSALWLFAIPGVVVGLGLILLLDDRDRVMEGAVGITLGTRMGRVLATRNVRVLLGASTVGAAAQGLGPLIVFVPLYLANGLELTSQAVGLLYTALLVGGVAGPMVAGRLSDLWGRRPLIVANLAISALTMGAFVLIGAAPVPVLALALLVLGAFAFTESSLVQVFLADSVAPGDRELVFGLYFAWVFTITGPWAALIGAIIDRAGFAPAFWLMAASYVVTALLVLPAREGTESAQ